MGSTNAAARLPSDDDRQQWISRLFDAYDAAGVDLILSELETFNRPMFGTLRDQVKMIQEQFISYDFTPVATSAVAATPASYSLQRKSRHADEWDEEHEGPQVKAEEADESKEGTRKLPSFMSELVGLAPSTPMHSSPYFSSSQRILPIASSVVPVGGGNRLGIFAPPAVLQAAAAQKRAVDAMEKASAAAIALAAATPKPLDRSILSAQQREALERVEAGKSVFFTGEAGTGKSFIIPYLREIFTKGRKKVAFTAFSGTAAALIGGCTFNSCTKIGKGEESAQMCAVKINKFDRAYMTGLHVLVCDEVSMLSAANLELASEVNQIVRSNRDPFGGLQVILIGDFLQLPPVFPKEDEREIERRKQKRKAATLKRRRKKRKLQQKEKEKAKKRKRKQALQKKKSQRTDRSNTSASNNKGSDSDEDEDSASSSSSSSSSESSSSSSSSDDDDDESSESESEDEDAEDPAARKKKPRAGKKDDRLAFECDLWDQMFGTENQIRFTQVFRQKEPKFLALLNDMRMARYRLTKASKKTLKECMRPLPQKDGIEPTTLMSNKVSVAEVNEKRLHELPDPEVRFQAKDVWEPRDKGMNVEKLDKDLPALRELVLKKGAQVMVIKNIPLLGLFNGSRGIVTGFTTNTAKPSPIVRFMNGKTAIIPLTVFEISSVGGKKPRATRTQFPLITAWALTIHKSQGATLDYCRVDISKCFSAGQAYVAISRARTLDGLEVIDFDECHVFADPRTLRFDRMLARWAMEKSAYGHVLTEKERAASSNSSAASSADKKLQMKGSKRKQQSGSDSESDSDDGDED